MTQRAVNNAIVLYELGITSEELQTAREITEKVPVYHFDVYRLEDTDEFYAMGGEEYFENGICIIEWGEQIETILPKGYTKISFNKLDENENFRELKIEKM